MPLPRWKKLAPEKQKAILDAAITEIGEHGVEGVSYNRIIKRAGVSKGAMYYYFDDREDLLATALLTMVDHLMGSYPRPELAPTTAAEFWAVARGVLRHGAHWFSAHPPERRAFQRLAGMPMEAAGRFPAVEEKVGGQILQIVFLGQTLGAVRSDLPFPFLMELVLSTVRTCDKWLVLHANEPEDVLEEKIGVVIDIYQRLVSPA
jgi:AcrR family transcriptional regulator